MKLQPRVGSSATSMSLWDKGIKKDDLLPRNLRGFYEKGDSAPPIRQSQPQMPPAEARKLDSSGSNLAQVWNTIVSEEPSELVRIKEDIKKVVGIESINAPVRGNQTGPNFKEATGLSFDLSNTSSGVQQTAILVTKIRTSPLDGLLLIEEPELHLHAGGQRALREIIQNDSADIQFFITTHSTIFTDFEKDSRVYLVIRDGIQSSVSPVSEPDDLKLVKAELGHSNVDLYGYDLVVFTEGESEALALPIIADSVGFSLANNGVLLRNLKEKARSRSWASI